LFAFFAVVIFKVNWVVSHLGLLVHAVLAAMVWISLLIGKPFTIQYAREQVSQEKWQHPVFIRINQILSCVWGLIFLFDLVVNFSFKYFPTIPHWVAGVLTNIAAIFGLWFVIWFPKWYRKKRTTKIPKWFYKRQEEMLWQNLVENIVLK